MDYGSFASLAGTVFRWFRRPPDPQRDKAAHEFRAALNRVRAELDPQTAAAVERATYPHRVALRAVEELAAPIREYRPYVPEGFQRDEFDRNWNEFGAYVAEEFSQMDGVLGIVAVMIPPHATELPPEARTHAIRVEQARQRTEIIGHLDRMLESARHR